MSAHQLIGALENDIGAVWNEIMSTEGTDGRYHALARTHFEIALYWLHKSVDKQINSPWDRSHTDYGHVRPELEQARQRAFDETRQVRRFKDPRMAPQPTGRVTFVRALRWLDECPRCGHKWNGEPPAELVNLVQCDACQIRFAVDEDGRVMDGENVFQHKCRKCEHSWLAVPPKAGDDIKCTCGNSWRIGREPRG